MKAYSVKDGGKGISFNIFVHKRQPGIVIDYATGESYLEEVHPEVETSEDPITHEVRTETELVGTN